MEGRESERGREAGAPEDGSGVPAAVAFRQLFERHFAELYRFVYRYVQSAEAAKDLVHDAFLQLWRQRDQVDLGGAGARSFLYTVARYRSLDHLRRRRVEQRWQRQYADPLMEEGAGLGAADPGQEFAANETAAAIQ